MKISNKSEKIEVIRIQTFTIIPPYKEVIKATPKPKPFSKIIILDAREKAHSLKVLLHFKMAKGFIGITIVCILFELICKSACVQDIQRPLPPHQPYYRGTSSLYYAKHCTHKQHTCKYV